MFAEQPPPQSVGIGLAGVANPTHNSLPGFTEGGLVLSILLLHLAQAATKPPDVLLDQQTVRGEDSVAEKANARSDGKDHVLGRMEPQPEAGQKVLNLFSYIGQMSLVVGEHEKVIDVTHVARDPQPVLH